MAEQYIQKKSTELTHYRIFQYEQFHVPPAFGQRLNYRVPPFQRDYSWTEKEWEDLWQDMVNPNQPIILAIWCCNPRTANGLTLFRHKAAAAAKRLMLSQSLCSSSSGGASQEPPTQATLPRAR